MEFIKLKTIVSLLVGVPAMMIVCGESEGLVGFLLQLLALAVLIAILAINGVFRKELENE